MVPNDFDHYEQMSLAVMDVLHRAVTVVEQVSIDEAYLDATGFAPGGAALAASVQAQVRSALGLPCSLGVGSNKLVAKVANDVGKKAAGKGRSEPPNAITVVPPGDEATFLTPLPVDALLGVGPGTAKVLRDLGYDTIGALAAAPPALLAEMFGRHGPEMVARANGHDPRPLVTLQEAKSVSKSTTFPRDLRDEGQLRGALRRLSGMVADRLRQKGYAGRTVAVSLRWTDFSSVSRQATLRTPTNDHETLYRTALALFLRWWPRGRAVRLMGVGVSNFDDRTQPLQLPLL